MELKEKILHLVLKRKWYELIDRGIKTEEYRDIKYLYCTRLLDEYITGKGWCKLSKHKAGEYDSASGLADGIKTWLKPRKIKQDGMLRFKDYNVVCFHLGYTNTTISFNIKNISIKTGLEEWGAEKGTEYFVIEIGDRIVDNI